MWNDVEYEPGELKVIAYDSAGRAADEKIIRTAGKPDHLVLTPNRKIISENGRDLVFINVKVVDKKGNICPSASLLVNFSVSGSGTFIASANGDPTCLESFQEPHMHLFSGQLTAIISSSEKKGEIIFAARAEGLGKSSVKIMAK
jgi:beta-galactosidase